MEGKIQVRLSMILVVALCASTLSQSGQAEVHVGPQFPSILGSPIDLTKCWSSLFNVQGCVIRIYKSLATGSFEDVEHECCKAFTEVDAKCWPKMFPLNPVFPPLLKNGCSRINAAAPTHTIPRFHITPKFPLPSSPVDLKKCWSSLTEVRGCVTEISKSVFTGKFDNVGQTCCKAFSAVDNKCWPHMFPLNPLFPPLLKNECSRISATAPIQK